MGSEDISKFWGNLMTCKFCPTPAPYFGFICDHCKPIFSAGERAGRNHVVKEIRQELNQLLRRLEAMEIK